VTLTKEHSPRRRLGTRASRQTPVADPGPREPRPGAPTSAPRAVGGGPDLWMLEAGHEYRISKNSIKSSRAFFPGRIWSATKERNGAGERFRADEATDLYPIEI
jgi:hypothetical protein